MSATSSAPDTDYTGRMSSKIAQDARRADDFATTHWSVVVEAGCDGSARQSAALAELCGSYWYPLYAYVRRRGFQVHDAQELTQGFFAELLDKGYVATAVPERGRFRAFLITAFKRFLGKQRDRRTAKKRGGGQTVLSLDFEFGESQYQVEPSHEATAERIFERRWALLVLQRTLDRLESEYHATGKGSVFAQLKPLLTYESDAPSHRSSAEALGISEGAVKVTAYRLRSRYQELLRDEISRTVTREEDVESELASLLQALSAQ